MKIKKKKYDIIIGVLALIALAIIVYSLIYIVKIRKYRDYYKLYAEIDNVSNISTGTKIFIQGFEIGKVSEVMIRQSGSNVSFLIVMQIKKEIILYEGTKGVISGLGLFGDSNIVMELPEEGEVTLKDEDFVEIEQDVAIKELIADAKNTIREIDKFIKEDLKETTKDTRVFVEKITTVVNDNADSISESIVLLNKDLKEFHGAVSTVNKLVGKNENTINYTAK